MFGTYNYCPFCNAGLNKIEKNHKQSCRNSKSELKRAGLFQFLPQLQEYVCITKFYCRHYIYIFADFSMTMIAKKVMIKLVMWKFWLQC